MFSGDSFDVQLIGLDRINNVRFVAFLNRTCIGAAFRELSKSLRDKFPDKQLRFDIALPGSMWDETVREFMRHGSRAVSMREVSDISHTIKEFKGDTVEIRRSDFDMYLKSQRE